MESGNNLLQDFSQAYSHIISGATISAQNHPVFSSMSAIASAMSMTTTTITTTTAEETTSTVVPYYFTSKRYAAMLESDISSKFEKHNEECSGSNKRSTTVRPDIMKPLASVASSANPQRQPQTGYGPSIRLTPEERDLFELLRRVRTETGLHTTTLRVAGGWVRDKLLATPEFQAYHKVFSVGSAAKTARLTSKFRSSPARLARSTARR